MPETSHQTAEAEAPAENGRPYFQKNPRVRLALWILVPLLVIAAFVAWRYLAVRETTDDAQIDGHITPISGRVNGTVVSVNFQDNQYVHMGDILVQLDPKDYEVAQQRAQADLAEAEAAAQAAQTNVPVVHISTSDQLETAQAALAAALKDVDAARARVREAEANHRKTVTDLERMQMLVQKDEVSRQRYDAAVTGEAASRAALESAQANVAAAESRVQQARAALQTAQTAPQQVAMTRSRYSSAQANVLLKKAAVQQAELNLQYTTIRAPANGIVSKRSVEVGQVIAAGQPLVALVNLDNLYVTANFKETQLKNMRVGQEARIELDAYDRELRGHVESFGGATGARFSLLPPENATGNYVKVVQRVPVKIVLEKGEDAEHKLRPGMSVEPTVFTGSSK